MPTYFTASEQTSGEAFPTPCWYGVGNASPDDVTCVGHSDVGNASSPTDLMPTHDATSGMPLPTFFPTSFVRRDTLP
ncbi:hypothetical protein E6C27_scaffold612G00130 [Cucumis melo var. makuwa]|uniref:Uncharacterized protein n=1 Tax=Cucumis melo var. makuwa TaxID=1194695 RepID=A0A5A7UZX7_CUCMM|nr:hypothetical protein E6C27_scaffold612G00130 [Cucumis melo var. makuwa]